MSENGRQVIYRQLVDEHELIQIPMIQRDYAQGRESEAHIRDGFLSAIEIALRRPYDDPSLPLNLDFIYGSVEGETGKSRFAPLDGQQRLTTLFLLHWFFAWNDERWDEFERMFLTAGHSRFSYRVRPSSSDFFDFLVNFRPDTRPEEVNLLSTMIMNQSDYFRSWRLDPTIQSTLVMLDAILVRFVGSNGLFERLWNQEYPAITFQLLDLDKFGLSDDLYIKMNARGVPLTPFETFKARYVQQLEAQFGGQTRQISEEEFSIGDFVSRRLDTAWMDLFWAEKKGSTSRSADVHKGILNLFQVIALVTRDPESDNCPVDITRLTRNQPSYSAFYSRGWLDEAFTMTLIPLLESWCSQGGGFQALLPSDAYFDEKKIFAKLTSDSMSLEIPEILQFMAYAFYIRLHEKSLEANAFQNWMRVVHNLVVNSNIDRADRLQGGFTAIFTLLPKSEKILKYFSSFPSTDGLGGFPNQQLNEEFLKSSLLLHHECWESLISRAELHGYFQGQIEFLLDFCGVVSTTGDNAISNWDKETHEELQGRFLEYLGKAEAMFSETALYRNNFIWQRALLSVGDYLFPMSAQRKSLLVYAATEAYSWKRLLRGYQEHEASSRQLLKKLWDQLEFDESFSKQLCELVLGADNLEPWREAFVKSSNAMKFCQKCTIRWESYNRIYLLSRNQMNSSHAELFTYQWYCDMLLPIKFQGGLAPLELKYRESVGTDPEPSIRFYWRTDNTTINFDVEWRESRFIIFVKKEDFHQTPDVTEAIIEETGFSDAGSLSTREMTKDEFMKCVYTLRDSLREFSTKN